MKSSEFFTNQKPDKSIRQINTDMDKVLEAQRKERIARKLKQKTSS